MSWPWPTGILRGLLAEDDDGQEGLDKLCKLCNRLRFDFRYPDDTWEQAASFEEKTIETPRVPHHTCISDLIHSAVNGCHLCTIIIIELCDRVLLSDVGKTVKHHNTEMLAKLMSTFKAQVYISAYEHRQSLMVYDGSDATAAKTSLVLSDGKYPGENGIRDTQQRSYHGRNGIVSKLNLCRDTHEACQLEGRVTVPTRLVDVSRGIDNLRLVTPASRKGQSKQMKTRLQRGYATVSHRWLPKLSCKMTTQNIKRFHNLIPVSTLPAHFQDAALLTSAMGLYYLWIDSLCIIQEGDEHADWAREAVKMASIYRGAAFNISIDMRDTSSSMFPINLREVRPCGLPAIKGRFVMPQVPPNQRALEFGGLERRGWIMQERLLPRRVVHCTPWGLAWECCELYEGFSSYSFVRRNLRRHDDCTPEPSMHDQTTTQRAGLNHDKQLELFNSWIAIIERYSRRELTVATDVLLAVSGLAKRFQYISPTPITYIAGLWEEDLSCQLGWFTEREETPSKSGARSECIRSLKGLKQYRAPSFSWGSVDCEVSFLPRKLKYGPDYQAPEVNWKYVLQLLSSSINSVGGDPMGLVKEASIKLRGLSTCPKSFSKCAWVTAEHAVEDEKYSLGCSGMLTMDDETLSWMYELKQLPEDAILLMLCNFPLIAALVLMPHRKKKRRYRRHGLWQLTYEETPWTEFNYQSWSEVVVTLI